MSSYSLAKSKEQLSRLIDEAPSGQIVTITRDGKPVAERRGFEVAPKQQSSAHLIDEIAARAKQRPWFGKSAVDLLREMRDEEPQEFMRANRRRRAALVLAIPLIAMGAVDAVAEGANAHQLQCATAAVIHALHDAPARKDGLNRFIIVSLGEGQQYVQCRFVDGDAGALCEASSGAYGPTGANRMVLTAKQRRVLSKLGFVRKAGSKNYVREFSMASRADIEGLGFFMVQTLIGVYGLRREEKFVIQSSLDSRAAISRACPEALQFFAD